MRRSDVSTYEALTPRRIPGCKRQKGVLEPRELPTVSQRGYVHDSPASLVPSVSAPNAIPQTLLDTPPPYRPAHRTPATDLYGPFWGSITPTFCFYVFPSLAHSIASYPPSDEPVDGFALLGTAFARSYTLTVRDGLRHIQVLCLCKRVPHPANGTPPKYCLSWGVFHRQAGSRVSKTFITLIVLFKMTLSTTTS